MASESDLDDLAGFLSTPSPHRKDTELTVTRLADSISAEEADRASRQVREAISQQQRQLADLQRFSDENKSLYELVLELPDSVSHRIMVPFGKAAFFPGRLIHTNEFLVLLGENHYAERSAKQTVEILERRGDFLDRKISSAKAQVADLEAEYSFVINTAEEANAGLVEIREEYQGSGQLQPNPASISSITAAGSHVGSKSILEATTSGSGSVGADEDREHDYLMARLSELELAEAAEEADEAEEDSGEEVDDDSNAGVFKPFRSNPKKSEVLRNKNDLLEEEYDSEEEEEEDGQLDNSDDEEYDIEEAERSSDEEINAEDVKEDNYGTSKLGEKETAGPVVGRPLSRFARVVYAKQGAVDSRPTSQRVTFQQGSLTKKEFQLLAYDEFPSTTLEKPEGTQGFGLQKAFTGIVKEQSSAEPATVNDPQVQEAQQSRPISAFTGIVTEHSSTEPATANEPQVQEAQQSRPISKFKMRQAQEGRRLHLITILDAI